MRFVTVLLFMALAVSAAPSTAQSILGGSELANWQFSDVTTVGTLTAGIEPPAGGGAGEPAVNVDVTLGGGGQWWIDPNTPNVPGDYIDLLGGVVLPQRPVLVPEIPALLLAPMGLGALLGVRRRLTR